MEDKDPLLLDDCYTRLEDLLQLQSSQLADNEILLNEKKLLDQQIDVNNENLDLSKKNIQEILTYFKSINMHEPYLLPPNHV